MTHSAYKLFLYFVQIQNEEEIITLYSIKLHVSYNRNGMCLLRGTKWIFRHT
jgi:hypothetical protein